MSYPLLHTPRMNRLLSEKKKTRGSAKQNTPACTSEARASMLDPVRAAFDWFQLVSAYFNWFQVISPLYFLLTVKRQKVMNNKPRSDAFSEKLSEEQH